MNPAGEVSWPTLFHGVHAVQGLSAGSRRHPHWSRSANLNGDYDVTGFLLGIHLGCSSNKSHIDVIAEENCPFDRAPDMDHRRPSCPTNPNDASASEVTLVVPLRPRSHVRGQLHSRCPLRYRCVAVIACCVQKRGSLPLVVCVQSHLERHWAACAMRSPNELLNDHVYSDYSDMHCLASARGRGSKKRTSAQTEFDITFLAIYQNSIWIGTINVAHPDSHSRQAQPHAGWHRGDSIFETLRFTTDTAL
mmetsp:Transcript_120107/g.275168  ORF Transcript_120107/g.275168 Transcript_120107/m.275168 type:complete len:249 (-) Transcript_120107:815-1561(-)